MSQYETEFWRDRDEYHDLARNFERSIEYKSPEYVTSRKLCVCLDYCSWCDWAATAVQYPTYTGPRVQNY